MTEKYNLREIWYDYLQAINSVAEYGNSYTWNKRRCEMHDCLVDYYNTYYDNFDREEFKIQCSNLNETIGYNPPIDIQELDKYVEKAIEHFKIEFGGKQ